MIALEMKYTTSIPSQNTVFDVFAVPEKKSRLALKLEPKTLQLAPKLG